MLRFGGWCACVAAAVILASGRPATAAGVSSFESFYHPGLASDWNAAVMSALPAGGTNVLFLPVPAIAGQAESVRAAARVIASSLPLEEGACATRRAEEFRACLAARDKARRQLVHSALSVMRAYSPARDAVAAERESATLGILHFMNGDYPAAKQASVRAYELGMQGGRVATVPAFVAAASAWHEERPNSAEAWDRFRYAVAAEPSNPLLPMLFAIYLDRLSPRSGDQLVSVADLDKVNALTASLGSSPHKEVVQRILLARYLAQMQEVRRLAHKAPGTDENPLELATRANGDHAALLTAASNLAATQADLPPSYRQALDEGQREQASLAQRVAVHEKELALAKSAEGQPGKVRSSIQTEAPTPAGVEKTEAPSATDAQPAGESAFSSIFNRVKSLFK